MKRRISAALALGCATAIALTACGSMADSDKAGGGSGNGNNSNAAEGFTATKVTVEGSVPKTSASGANQALVELGRARARFARTNREGGVAGRTIDFRGAIDNQIDPSKDLSIAKQIVLQDKAFAAAPVVSAVLSQGGQFWTQNKIPFFGWGISRVLQQRRWLRFHRMSRPHQQGQPGLDRCRRPAGQVARHPQWQGQNRRADRGGRHGRVLRPQNRGGGIRRGWLEGAYAKASLPSGSPVTDFTPFAQAILTSNAGGAPDVMFHVTKPPNIIGLSNSLRNSGFHGIQVNAVTYGQSFLARGASRAALNGEYVYIQYGSFENGAAANKQMLADVQAVAPQQTQLTQDIAIGYYSADLFLDDLQKTGRNRGESVPRSRERWFDVPGPQRAGNALVPEESPKRGALRLAGTNAGRRLVNKVSLSCFDTVPLSVLGGS